jgi:hypothetical protein
MKGLSKEDELRQGPSNKKTDTDLGGWVSGWSSLKTMQNQGFKKCLVSMAKRNLARTDLRSTAFHGSAVSHEACARVLQWLQDPRVLHRPRYEPHLQ